MLRARVLIPFAIATLIWGSTWIVIRGQLGVVPPTWSIAYRFLVAGIAMFAYAAWTRQPLRLDARGAAFAAVFGVFQFVLNFNFIYRAEAHIASGLVAVLFALLIVPNALLGAAILRQPLQGRFLLGATVALAGVGLLILREARLDAGKPEETLLGVVLVLLGVVSASVANIMQALPMARRLPMATVLAWGMIIGTALDSALAFATVGPPVVDWSPGYLCGVLYLGIFASAISFTCYFGVIREVGPARAAYSGVITPVLAMLLSTLFEGYRWTALAAAGGTLAMAGLLIALTARSPDPKSG